MACMHDGLYIGGRWVENRTTCVSWYWDGVAIYVRVQVESFGEFFEWRCGGD